MPTYTMKEVVGVSEKSYEDAIKIAMEDAKAYLQNTHQQLEGEGWFHVIEQRGSLIDGEIKNFQIKLNVSFNIKK